MKTIEDGAPEEIRTPDPQIRSLVLYPAELRARNRAWITANTGRSMTGRELTCYLATGNVKSKTIAAKDFRRLRAPSFARHETTRSGRGERWIACGPGGVTAPATGGAVAAGDRGVGGSIVCACGIWRRESRLEVAPFGTAYRQGKVCLMACLAWVKAPT